VAHDFVARDFQFKTGEHMDVHIRYYTVGSPVKRADGKIGNAVLLMHGTTGSGTSLFIPPFAGVLFCSGCLLDANKYFIISPDNIGHGNTSKPSDGMRTGFPHYDYDDMIEAQYKVVTQALGVDHLRLVIGTSMGCMHAWLWAVEHSDFIDASMPLGCLPIELSGRNEMWRRMIIDGIRNDPAWNNGNYTQPPLEGLRIAEDILVIAGSAPLVDQLQAPTQAIADRMLEARVTAMIHTRDANDLLYQFEASRSYNPAPKLETITAAVMAINSKDDFIDPPELGILEREIKRVKHGCAILLPITNLTRGHGTHTFPMIWGAYLAQLLQNSGGLAPGTSWTGTPASGADEKTCGSGN
jgi:homoserine O-acetyltransferase